MKRSILNSLLWAAGLTLAAAAQADGSGPCGIATTVRADGTVELSNTAATARCDTPASTPVSAPATPVGAPVSAPSSPSSRAPSSSSDPYAAPAADAQSTQADPPMDPRQQYRDSMLQGAEGTTAANPSVSRRYKMMSKETYQATVLGGAPQGSQAGTAPSQ
jgi:hypothetical protein